MVGLKKIRLYGQITNCHTYCRTFWWKQHYPICPTVSIRPPHHGITTSIWRSFKQKRSVHLHFVEAFLLHLKFSTDSQAPYYHPAGRRIRIDSTLFCRIRDLSLLLPRINSIFRCSLIMLVVYGVEHEVSCTSSDWIDLGDIVCLSRQTWNLRDEEWWHVDYEVRDKSF